MSSKKSRSQYTSTKSKKILRKRDTQELKSNSLILKDPPSLQFLNDNIKDERKAIEIYMKESDRTDDPVLKKIFHDIAVDEMKHLGVLESISDHLKEG